MSPDPTRAETLRPVGSPEPARAADLSALATLLDASGLPFKDLTARHLEHFRVCRADGTPVAAVGLEVHGRVGLLRSLAVAPPFRGHGLGTVLVRDIEAHATALGLDALYLLTTTADVFFVRLGYRVIDRATVPVLIAESEEFARLCPASAVCLTRSLGVPAS